MDPDVTARARARFDSLWASMQASIDTAVASGWAPPQGLCVSALSRYDGMEPAELIDRLERAQNEVASRAASDAYHPTSLHLSLLGCTPRESTAGGFTHDRVAAIGSVVADVLASQDPVRMQLGRLSVVGVQVFVEVVPQTAAWSHLRARMADRLVRIGEEPITYPDTEPVHLNLGLLRPPSHRHGFAEEFASWDLRVDTKIDVRVVDLVVTDFRLTPGSVQDLMRFVVPTSRRWIGGRPR